MHKTMSDWPKHPDGRPVKLGEMPKAKQMEILREVFGKLKAELESPKMQEPRPDQR